MSKFTFTDEVMFVNEDGIELTPCTPHLPLAPQYSTDKVQVLLRIKAMRNIDKHRVKVGDLGGFISKEGQVLSQSGDCWVGKRAKALRGCRIEGNALLSSSAILTNWSTLRDNALVSGSAILSNSLAEDDSVIGGESHGVIKNMRFSKDAHVLFPNDIISIRGIGSGLNISFIRAKKDLLIYSIHRTSQVRRIYSPDILLESEVRMSGVWLSQFDKTLLKANLELLRNAWK